MRRVLLVASLWCAACGPKFAESVSHPSDTTTQVCNDETMSPRGTAGMRCRSRRQIEDDHRFAKDLKLDSHPTNTYNQ